MSGRVTSCSTLPASGNMRESSSAAQLSHDFRQFQERLSHLREIRIRAAETPCCAKPGGSPISAIRTDQTEVISGRVAITAIEQCAYDDIQKWPGFRHCDGGGNLPKAASSLRIAMTAARFMPRAEIVARPTFVRPRSRHCGVNVMWSSQTSRRGWYSRTRRLSEDRVQTGELPCAESM